MSRHISNKHQAYLAAVEGPQSAIWQDVAAIRARAGLSLALHDVAHDIWRLGGWRLAQHTPPPAAVTDTDALRAEYLGGPPVVVPPPAVDAPEIAAADIGNWGGHFLQARDFFSPGLASLPPAQRAAIFEQHRADGYTHILINAEQDDWGPRKGHPEWTHGGFTAYASDAGMARLVEALKEARRAGLAPWVGVLDQPSLVLHINEIVSRSRDLVNASWRYVAGYMLSWEIREVWTDSTLREHKENMWISEVDWKGRDVGIHYQAAAQTFQTEDPGLGGGINRYRTLENLYPGHVVRMLQYHHAASDETLRQQTEATCTVVHADHGLGKFMNFEHSSELNQPTIYTTAQVARRRQVIMNEVSSSGITAARTGFLN